ncbi:hypothetical protein [Aeromonas caviae]|uniref:Tape measure protein n=1 Tax=Aeromonas caviae TaxID=648 RepID=A0AAV4YSZ6_AERCA|nr:hypothetical protein [Aeromonas caviae]GJA33269.1 hypothetical protein KAM341_29470 [Aeromonas caviae]GJA37739.1 hypothetical protein KAM342_29820 [Aeromonas caviae]GJA43292.1 hypothetical protein KAM343_40880 [Aeromonas caviae]GJA52290.1 hypothetical protein KAM347_40810 [Aeromonas caviae]GJA60556.1 hypothetical protein KAM350_35490 [Aeromonas caviae]
MTEILVSKITNIIDFKIHESNYKKSVQRIKKMAGMWGKVTSQYDKAVQAGRRAAGTEQKAHKRTELALIRQQKAKKETLRADNIRHSQMIKDNIGFRQQLQKTNMEFLKGSLSAKERAATIGQLTKQYRALNQQAGRYNQSSKALGTIRGVRRGVGSVTRLGVAAGAAGVVGGGFVAQNQYNKIKEQGQDFEGMKISFQNTFGDRWIEISSIARKIADDAGADILETGKALTNYVSIVKSLGIETDQAIELYKKQSNMTASYGMSKDQVAGFQYGLMQTLASNTLEDFKQAMDWTPQIKADLLKFVKDTMGISQKEFMGNLTNGKYNFKDIWLKFVEATSPKYAQMSAKFKSSSIAQDARVGNELSIAIYRIFESSGFKSAMQAGAKIVQDWAKLLESNATKIGEIFGNLYTIVGQLSKQGFEDLSKWLQELTADDIKTYFKDMKSSVSEFLLALKSLAAFINDVLPDRFVSHKQSTSVPESQRKNYDADTYGKVYVQKEKELLKSGLDPSEAARGAEKFALSQALKIPQPTIPQSAISFNARGSSFNGGGVPSNFSGKLNLKIDAQVNKDEFNNFVDFKIHDNNMMQLNLLTE